jgi:hypothetical protein
MGTGVTFSPLLPDYFFRGIIPSKLDNAEEVCKNECALKIG